MGEETVVTRVKKVKQILFLDKRKWYVRLEREETGHSLLTVHRIIITEMVLVMLHVFRVKCVLLRSQVRCLPDALLRFKNVIFLRSCKSGIGGAVGYVSLLSRFQRIMSHTCRYNYVSK